MRRSPKETEESARGVTRRGLIIGGGMAAVFGVLLLRMRHMQVEQAGQFRMLAEQNRIKVRLIAPQRGLIMDRNGVLIAENGQNYRAVIVREDTDDLQGVLNRLTRIVPMSDADMERMMKEIMRHRPFVPITVADQLPWEQFSQIAMNAPALPGITPEMGLSRYYPFGPDFAHALGYVGPVSERDLEGLEDPDPVLVQIPKFQIGKSGVENKMEEVLRGKAGTKRIEVNAAGRVMRELGRDEGEIGAELQLTLDHRLQRFALERLGNESAALVAMDVEKGDILALVSSPSFDPNLFVRGISMADYRALMDDDHRPLTNKAVQGTYPPGSTFKMVTALAALEAGVVTPEETVHCPGHMNVGNHRFHCWRRGGHGRVAMVESLAQSCDVYYYEIARRVGIDKISEMARRLGLGVRHDLPLSAVAEGLAPTQAWKRARRGEGWVVGDTINASIGQGFVLASPLQLAVMTARLASGRAVEPRLIRAIDGVEVPVEGGADLGLDPVALNYVRRGMDAVMNGRTGTARGSRLADENMLMAGKTGTSQVRNITAAERAAGVINNADLPWNRRDHALFVAYAPVHAPKIAVAVVVEHGGGGGAVAAPLARDVIAFALGKGMAPAADGQRRDETDPPAGAGATGGASRA